MNCNTVERNDGLNIARKRLEGWWIGISRTACNKPAVAIGEWRKHQGRVAFLYLCQDHFDYYRELDFEPDIDRGYFKFLANVKG